MDKKMKKIHICLVSKQPIPNLTFSLQDVPELVILLATSQMVKKTERLKNVFEKHGIKVEDRQIEAYDINNVMQVSEEIIKNYCNDDIVLNITSGTKIGALGVFQSFYTSNQSIVYVNTAGNEIINLSTNKTFSITIDISAIDYLGAYGFKITKFTNNKSDNAIIERRNITKEMFNLCLNDEKLIGYINYILPTDINKTNFPTTVSKLPKNEQLQKILNSLKIKKGVIKKADIAKFLKGFWFEEYVYLILKSLKKQCGLNEIFLNVEGKWDEKGKEKIKNEFDVIISKNNRLFYISCKTANPNRAKDNTEESIGKEYLYELDSLGQKALGIFGKGMLLSARAITNQYVIKRAKDLNIKIIDGKGLVTLKNKLIEWLK